MELLSIIKTLLSSNYGTAFIRISLATIFGGLIGIDRELKRRPAGLRTFALVSVGSALAMMTNEYLFHKYGAADISRMSAQVISGVGFLGAGTIIVTGRQRVKGLTTAACLWATASMGIAIGAGFYFGGILGFLSIFFSTTLLQRFDEKLNTKSKLIELYIEANKAECILDLLKYIHENNFSVTSFEKLDKSILNTNIVILLELNLRKKLDHNTVIAQISLIDGINYIEDIK